MVRIVALLALAVITSLSAPPAMAADDPPPDIGAHVGVDTQTFDVDGILTQQPSGTVVNQASSNNGPPRQYVRGPLCQTELTRSDLGPQCPNNDPIVNICLDGTQARDPLWSRTQQADGTWTQWAIVQDYFCPGDAPLLAAIDREWTAMKPQPSDIALQPNTGWVIATVPTVAMAADAPRLHSAVLLGANVDIRATAQGYRWEWGDGTHTATSDPGKPYPNATLTHTYPHASDAATVALTTTWTGEYRVNGGPWLNFDSTINSTSTPIQLTIYDPRSRLVNCDLDGKCRIEAQG